MMASHNAHQMVSVGSLVQHAYQHTYDAWTAQPSQPLTVRQYPSTSSAYSASAHPDEDWTKVSDLAERRRIQNRIAQRNYRKKIKERMQFLESKAGYEGQAGSAKKSTKSASNKKQQAAHSRRRSSQLLTHQTNPANLPTLQAPQPFEHPFTPPMNPEDQPFFSSPSPPVASPPPFQAYASQYSARTDDGYYAAAQPVTSWMGAAAMTTTAAPTLPPMNHFADAASAYNSCNGKGNESMSFAGLGDYSLGVSAAASPYDSSPHVSSHHHQCFYDQAPPSFSSQQETNFLPSVSTFPSYGRSGSDVISSSSSLPKNLAAPALDRSRLPPPPPAQVQTG